MMTKAKSEPIVSVSVRFPRSLHKRVEERAKADSRSFNTMVVLLLTEILDSGTPQEIADLNRQVQENKAKLAQLLPMMLDLSAQVRLLGQKVEPRRACQR